MQDDPEQNIWGRLLSIRKVLLKKPWPYRCGPGNWQKESWTVLCGSDNKLFSGSLKKSPSGWYWQLYLTFEQLCVSKKIRSLKIHHEELVFIVFIPRTYDEILIYKSGLNIYTWTTWKAHYANTQSLKIYSLVLPIMNFIGYNFINLINCAL